MGAQGLHGMMAGTRDAPGISWPLGMLSSLALGGRCSNHSLTPSEDSSPCSLEDKGPLPQLTTAALLGTHIA